MKKHKPTLSVFTKTFLVRYFLFIVPVTIMVLILTIGYERILQESISALPLEYSQQITDAVRGILMIHAYAIVTVLFFFFFVVIGTLLSIWWTFKPTLKLLKAMDKVSGGDFSVRLPVDSNDEIGRIFKRFNAMTEGLEEAKLTEARLERTKFEFISGSVFHLRSILGTSKWSLNSFLNLPKEQLKSVLKDISLIEHAYESNNQGIKAIQEILDLTELESEKIEYTFIRTDINKFINELGEDYKVHAAAKNIDFTINSKIEPGTKTLIDVVHSRLAIRNLLLNAVQFTNQGGKIEFTAEEKNNGFVFMIRDSGVGISENDLPKVFEKFFRGEQALRLGLPGLGIGLYISKLIIEKLGGTIDIESEINSGTNVICFIPKKRD